MAAKKRKPSEEELENEEPASSSSDEEEESDTMDEDDSNDDKPAASAPPTRQNLKPMEKRKKRKAMDKERHRRAGTQSEQPSRNPDSEKKLKLSSDEDIRPRSSGLPQLRIAAFRDLPSAEASVREAAAEELATDARMVQAAFEMIPEEQRMEDDSAVKLEAEKDDGLGNLPKSLRYSLRRLLRGVSSSRECARQGFAVALSAVLATVPSIPLESVMRLIPELLEFSSSMKGQEARDSLLGRLFAYGALAKSGRVSTEWASNKNRSCLEDFVGQVMFLAGKKQYLQEPAVTVLLDLADKLPAEALSSTFIEAPKMKEWFQKAIGDKNPDALLLALKLQERIPLDQGVVGQLLPHPFSASSFFSSEHLSLIAPCLQETTFCQPRVHSIWPVMIDMLISDFATQEDSAHATPSKKHKKSRKGNTDDNSKNIKAFNEVLIERSLLASSHDRKHLALDVLLFLISRLPVSCINIILSFKLVQCLMDILSTKGTWLYNAAQHFLNELINWVGDIDDRLISTIVCLQKHSNGRFDGITHTNTIKSLVAKFKSSDGCKCFVQSLMDLFIEDSSKSDESSDQSQTTDENSEKGSLDEPTCTENTDYLKNWVVETMSRVLKNLKLGSDAKSLSSLEVSQFIEEKYHVQKEIMKFLAVQGLFTASLGTEVTSFELQEKFRWPKEASSTSLRRLCISQLQLLIEDAQKGEGSNLIANDFDSNDLGSYFVCFLNTLSNIPSVSLFRTLSEEDDRSFKRLLIVETNLSHEERAIGSGPDASKMHALRYLLIQLLLQILLRPGEFSEAASELVTCCKKAFPEAIQSVTTEEEDDTDDDTSPIMIDVLTDTLLSLLPQSSGPMCYAIEQVFKFFCNEIPESGLLQMLRIVNKDLLPLRRQSTDADDEDDDEEDDEILDVKDSDDVSETEAPETGDGDSDSDGDSDEDQSGIADDNLGLKINDVGDDDMDDEAMFRMDSYITQFLKKSGKSGNDTATSQLVLFKLRVLSLLEIFLLRNPGKPQVLTIFSNLTRAFVKYQCAEGCKQLVERIGGILQKKIFKAKEYPKGSEIQVSSLVNLLEKSLKSASKARIKSVSSLAQNSSYWILKVIHAKNPSESELEGVLEAIKQRIVIDYFDNKKSRLKTDFLKELLRRHPWVGPLIFGFLLEKCANAKSEYRRIEGLDLVECIIKSHASPTKGDTETDISRKLKFLKHNLPKLCELIQLLLVNMPEKQQRRAGIRRFCTRSFHAISSLKLNKFFLKALKPDAYSACESQLGDVFLAFKNPA